jgi:hypothetical protein
MQTKEDLMLTPYSNDAISNILSEAKPFRNVVKRYWTEEEVRYL